jgi:hypothetical protein
MGWIFFSALDSGFLVQVHIFSQACRGERQTDRQKDGEPYCQVVEKIVIVPLK